MTRLEENKMIIDEMDKRTKSKPYGTYKEMVTLQLGAIATMLTDDLWMSGVNHDGHAWVTYGNVEYVVGQIILGRSKKE